MKELINLIQKLDVKIYVVGHKNPDLDSFCSSLALVNILITIGKNAKALINERYFERLKYFDCQKNIVSTVDVKDYAIILVDTNKVARIDDEYKKIYDNAKIKINVDHHEGNFTNADVVLSVENISSTCEIIYNISKELKLNIDKNTAELLLTGIVSDTNLFSTRTTSQTLMIASKLNSLPINYEYLINNFYLKKTREELKIIADMINNIKYDEFHYIVLDMLSDEYKNVTYEIISKKCIPLVLNDENISLLVVILKYGSKTKGEIRSKNSLDVSLLAKKLIGGGHKDAAGFANNKTVDEIIEVTKLFLKEEK